MTLLDCHDNTGVPRESNMIYHNIDAGTALLPDGTKPLPGVEWKSLEGNFTKKYASRQVLKLAWNYSFNLSFNSPGAQRVIADNFHYSAVIIRTMVSQVTVITTVYSIVYSGADQRKHQSPASLAFVRGIHRWQRAGTVENVCIWWRHYICLTT